MLTVDTIHAGYGSSEVLVGVSLEVRAGKLVTLIGPNGAGKSTTMRTISGLLRPSKGSILLDGKSVEGMDASHIARLGLAHVPEGRHIFGPLTVEDNLLLGGFRRLPRFIGFHSRARRDLERVYSLFPRLEERRRQTAGTLSGGEQQMLAIGRALMSDPKVILMDEPSMGLAPVLAEEVLKTIGHLKQSGVPLLLVEQMVTKALDVADYVYIMERGSIVIQGTPSDIRKDERVIAAYLG